MIQEAESSSPQVAINVLEATDATGNLLCIDIFLEAVLRIRDILVRIRIRGSVPLANGSGSDSRPAIFVIKNSKKLFFLCFFAYYFLNVHLYNFSKIKSHKEVTKH